MTKEEFLDGLRRALFSTGSQALIEYNLNYYSSYIDGELAKGRGLDDVMNELGDPRLIANSIKVAEGYSDVFVGLENEVIDENENNRSYAEKSEFEFNGKRKEHNYEDDREGGGAFKIYNFTGKSLILPLIIAIAVLILVVVVIAAVFSFLAPVLLPIIAVLIAVGIIKGITGNGNKL